MAVLKWDTAGDRIYKTGIDRGVLFLRDGRAAAWNGLTSVEETSNSELKTYYLDGVKYMENLVPGDFLAKLKAFTYPDEFDLVLGNVEVAPGLLYHDQPAQHFNLTYRTLEGNDIDGLEYGYQLHLLYNLIASPDSISFETLKGDASDPSEFAWTLSGTPAKQAGHRPTSHISLDSNGSNPDVFTALEGILYGTAVTNPRFPTVNEVLGMYGSFGNLIITDNGDGTWTATDRANNYITMLSDTEFQIDSPDSEYLDANTYTITDTIQE
jgi:hypothetical protein